MGAHVAGPVTNSREAIQAIECEMLHGALLDGNLQGEPVADIAAALARRQIPFIFVSGYGSEHLPAGFQHVPVVGKPFDHRLLIEIGQDLFSPAC